MNSNKKTPVIFNHSAAVDDFVSLAMLLTMPNIELKGMMVTNADCIAEPAMQTSWKVSQFFGIEHIPLSLSGVRGFNAFPWPYRGDCISMGKIDILKPYGDNTNWPDFPSGEEMLMGLLKEAVEKKEPVTILATGPITGVTDVVAKHPRLLEGIKEVIWMGGAFYVPGDLDPTSIPPQLANLHAEWNAYWDPFATDTFFKMFKNIRIFPQDISIQARVLPGFMARLQANSRFPYSAFVAQAYALVQNEIEYYMWNTAATVYLSGREDIYAEPKEERVAITQWGYEQGTTYVTDDPKAHQQLLYLNFKNLNHFYEYVLEQLKR